MTVHKRVYRKRFKIVLVPLGEVDYGVVNRLATNLVSIFNTGVDILQGMKIPKEAYNRTRGQYYSTVILNKLELLRSSSREKILGVLDEDLYIPSAGFVYGDADYDGKVAVLSLHRLKQQSLDMFDDEKLFLFRTVKEAVHQLGHLLGLKHCPNPRCVMHFTNSLLEADGKSEKLCDNCKRKVEPQILIE